MDPLTSLKVHYLHILTLTNDNSVFVGKTLVCKDMAIRLAKRKYTYELKAVNEDNAEFQLEDEKEHKKDNNIDL